MNAQQLKNAILQEAIEGRLVPQDPNDEPASALLARIRKEKEQLVKAGKLKKKDLVVKPISEDEIPFEIPETWEWVRLGDICNDISDIDHKMPPVVENGIPYISPLNFRKDGSIDYVNAKKISIEDFKQLSRKCKPERGDLIFPRYGTIGVIRKVDTDIDFLVSYSCATIKPHLKSADANYINVVLNSQLIQSVEIQRYINKTTQPNIGLQSIKLFLFPLPPLAEQHRIVAKIEELLPKVEEYGKAQDALNKLNTELPERLKKSILQEAISGRLVPQDPNDEPASVLLAKIRKEKEQLVKEGKLKKKDLEETPISEDEIPFEIPDGWEKAKLSFVTSLTEGEKREGNFVCLDAKYLRGKSTGELLSKGKFVSKNDNIILVDGENSGEVFTVPCDGYMGSTFKQLWVSNAMCLKYVLYFIMAYKEVLRNSKKGAAIPHLNKDIFYNLVIGIPPLAEQHRIVEKLEQVLGEIDKLKK